ncbi:uncharacterized protein [Elaeis guineensis]|uniref:Uncharacterized protein LOC105038541 n=1 Tax=Elaeis guineensis var. tenera TaxID=51953 RepID=A0A6I9QR01_ELAGV|nr:uncharacterized protein LOC105038541 [Elaeis guineensis]
MADAADLQDWELLSSQSSEDPKAFEGLDGEGDSYGGAIELDYFSLDSENRRIEKASLEEESEEGGVDSDNPTRVDPGSDSRDMGRSRGEVEFTGSGFPVKNFGGFWSDGSSDYPSSPADRERGEPGNKGDSVTEDSRDMGRSRGEVECTGSGFPVKNSSGFWSDGSSDYRSSPADSERGEPGNKGDSVTEVGVEGIEAGHQEPSDDEGGKSLDFGGSGGSEGIETGHEEHGVEESGELAKMGDGLGSSEGVSNSEGKKKILAWWKMPLDFIKFYVCKMRPVWSISIAAAIMAFVMLGRKLYKMKHKSRTIQLKIALDDKKVSQLKLRAARLNEAFTVVRRVPVIRRVPAGGVTAWPVVNLR